MMITASSSNYGAIGGTDDRSERGFTDFSTESPMAPAEQFDSNNNENILIAPDHANSNSHSSEVRVDLSTTTTGAPSTTTPNGGGAHSVPMQTNYGSPVMVQSPSYTYQSPVRKSDIGNSKRACGGRCILPPDWKASLWLNVLVFLPVVVFLTSVVPPDEWYSFVFVILNLSLGLIIHMFAVTCDPGILPAKADVSKDSPVQPKTIVLEDGTTIIEKVCHTCNIIRPPKSSHCPICDNCVEEYDHHCGVVGSCVARRTFRFFTLYFYTMTPLSGYIFLRSVIACNNINFGEWSEQSDWERWKMVAAVGCSIYSACGGCCFLGQSITYTSFACTGSNAKIRFQQSGGRRAVYGTVPDEWGVRIWWNRLFGKMPESRV